MTKRQPWFQREFPGGLPVHLLPVVVERLRGTPARLAERLSDVPHDVLTRRHGDTWSVQENVGHLLDLEPLWRLRVADLAARRPEFAAADLENRKTHQAHHNAASLTALLGEFRQQRVELVRQFEAFSDGGAEHTARHSRLGTPMNVIDLAFFVAEHDDYHLAPIPFVK